MGVHLETRAVLITIHLISTRHSHGPQQTILRCECAEMKVLVMKTLIVIESVEIYVQ